ncbi:DUF3300 domain-containing protein [Pseudomonas sp. JQ170C]|uniref:DUF3300 domain-containing protein n=1 Tax=unclassified Pseudomonas TaxID=196821 RepID=UPI000FB94F82|nr:MULTISPECIES: DUF3300 domain-containing protein [unclassified Pseudomonas]WRO78214.1 DUF3300 domain-containing protein [Pseudomonas sp. 170C]
MSACLYRAILLTIAMFALSGCSDEDSQAKPSAAAPASATPAAPVTPAAPAAPVTPVTPPAPSEAVFSTEQLDQMLAPLALYPDALLAQVLMATTYPGNVADAVAWSKAHPKASGDAAVKQVADQPWDPSVQSLVAFPQVLATLGQDPVWVQRVGDAFLAQPDAVMNSVQRLRAKAKAAGHLESNEQQTVIVQPASAPAGGTTTVVQGAAPAQTIVIQPTNPQVVYVPSYNPTVVYGSWPYPASPPAYYPPSPGYAIGTALATGLAFGAGVAIVNSLWGDCDWGHNDVDIDVNRYNNINVNRRIDANQNNWQHNPQYRNGVPYRDQASRTQFDRRLPGSEQRTALRGDTPARVADRQRARESLAQRGIEAPATSNLEARQRVQSADRERAQQSLEQRGIGQSGSARERAQVADRQLKNDGQARQRAQATQQNRQNKPSAHNNQQVRKQVRQQHAGAQAPRNNALAGARDPAQSRLASNRGQVSRQSFSRPSGASAGHAVQRPVRMQSHGGGRRR